MIIIKFRSIGTIIVQFYILSVVVMSHLRELDFDFNVVTTMRAA